MSGLTKAEIRDRFSYHPATVITGPLHDKAREKFIEVGDWIVANVPAGERQELAVVQLQQALMWTNAAIAIDTPAPAPDPIDSATDGAEGDPR